ncbi:hypothetical protein SD71_16130 [Cohnella kolymensis]|uniref:Uncharacterized protein n=1 Tax=Cohnella kolymensis TaxID=1590652 RepID=A0ABR5A281_9BACL|nr:hypothetical protein [Cohnella kolymensis]KIL35154.1 hypothetical protein SD71_16130 [Cohnella kolymensis]
MQVNFIYTGTDGKKNNSFDLTRELSDGEVYALLNTEEIMYAKKNGSSSQTSAIVQIIAKQFDVYDNKPRLNIIVKEKDENQRTASAFFS